MTTVNRLRTHLIRLLTVALAAVVAASLAPAPAHAALGSPIPVQIQLQSQGSAGGVYQVGRLEGTLQFDSSKTSFRLSVQVCRQSSYTPPNVTIYVNGAVHQVITPNSPHACGPTNTSGRIDQDFHHGGVINNVTISLQGIHFDMWTAKEIVRSRSYNNPFK